MMTIQNQTDPAQIAGIGPQTPGIGIFAVPDPTQRRFGAVTKVVLQDITYNECIQYGYLCVAFKWVQSMSVATVTGPCPTPGAPCVPLTGCAHDLCFCIEGQCQ
jgi:hypothetical protein